MNKLSVSLQKREKIAGFLYLAFQFLLLAPLLTFGNALLPTPLSLSELNFVFFCVNFLATTVIFRKLLLRCGKISLKAPFRTLKWALLGFICYTLLSQAIGIIILFISPDFMNLNDASISGMVQDDFVLIGFSTVILVPVAEELLYRGLIFGSIYNKSRVLAYIVSIVVFCLIHMVGYIGLYSPINLLLSFLQYIPAGLCLGWAYAKSDSIFAPILIHITINQMGILAMR